MEINILHLIEGAKKAEGLTVIIDVFRAFSLECYMYAHQASEILPVASLETAYQYKNEDSTYILVGERNGKKCDNFDYGNSPCTMKEVSFEGKKIIHTTSAGTQGVANAVYAEEIITGSLVNAKAVASYILKKNPAKVSLVCMGNAGVRLAKEDELCALYIKSILEGNEILNIQEQAEQLRYDGGEHFFDQEQQEVYPEEDFWMCVQCNIFPFIIRMKQCDDRIQSEQLWVR